MSVKSNGDVLISVCIVVRNARNTIENFLSETAKVMTGHYNYYELLIVDNSSSDETCQLVESLQTTLPNVRLLHLSRIYRLETAMTAALDNSIGDYVVLIDSETDPPSLIPDLVTKAQSGYDVVAVRRPVRYQYSWVDRTAVEIFFRFANRILGGELHFDDTHFQVLSRLVVNSITQIRRKRRYLKYFNDLIGFKSTYIVHDDPEFARQRRTINRVEAISLAVDLIISNSAAPLRAAVFIGTLASLLNLLYLGYIIIVTLVKRNIVEGWLTTSITSTTMFFFLFVILTILGEYIARILEETKDEPLYFIEYEKNSAVSSYSREKRNETLNVMVSNPE
jgi:glycosyltransferase involved in cell wall biosynthesis